MSKLFKLFLLVMPCLLFSVFSYSMFRVNVGHFMNFGSPLDELSAGEKQVVLNDKMNDHGWRIRVLKKDFAPDVEAENFFSTDEANFFILVARNQEQYDRWSELLSERSRAGNSGSQNITNAQIMQKIISKSKINIKDIHQSLQFIDKPDNNLFFSYAIVALASLPAIYCMYCIYKKVKSKKKKKHELASSVKPTPNCCIPIKNMELFCT